MNSLLSCFALAALAAAPTSAIVRQAIAAQQAAASASLLGAAQGAQQQQQDSLFGGFGLGHGLLGGIDAGFNGFPYSGFGLGGHLYDPASQAAAQQQQQQQQQDSFLGGLGLGSRLLGGYSGIGAGLTGLPLSGFGLGGHLYDPASQAAAQQQQQQQQQQDSLFGGFGLGSQLLSGIGAGFRGFPYSGLGLGGHLYDPASQAAAQQQQQQQQDSFLGGYGLGHGLLGGIGAGFNSFPYSGLGGHLYDPASQAAVRQQ